MVSWKSSKQDIVVDSTCESAYIAASETSNGAAWLKNFIGDLKVVPTIRESMELFCDNEGTVSLTKEPKYHGRYKHINRKYLYIRHQVEEGHLLVKIASSKDNVADHFTMALSIVKQYKHVRELFMSNVLPLEASNFLVLAFQSNYKRNQVDYFL